MKKNKRSLKKLTLNKKVVSKLEGQQANGGTGIFTVVVCPIETRWNCPILTINCPRTLVCPIDTLACPIDTIACPTDSIACPTDSIACPTDTIACPF
ncbi:hypothetical protein [Kordia sp.]|uniref:hypothetical protein n=1 Tax=Kordia sp. TaxID=1965332 RepID=UPI0025B9D157|nr:hypothetical protein [Kordia sp.]MCH2193425.1 hypothetical protein [Kordia sp.]